MTAVNYVRIAGHSAQLGPDAAWRHDDALTRGKQISRFVSNSLTTAQTLKSVKVASRLGRLSRQKCSAKKKLPDIAYFGDAIAYAGI